VSLAAFTDAARLASPLEKPPSGLESEVGEEAAG
jgi:hypothetical protein